MSAPVYAAVSKRTQIPAKPPVAAPVASGLAVSFAIAMIALGLVAGRDVLVWTGAIRGSGWISGAVKAVDGLAAQWWMLPGGIAVAVVGLLIVIAAVKPRRRTHRPLTAPDTWIRPRDIIRLTASACQAITGVANANASGSARRIAVSITPLAGYDVRALNDAAHTVVAGILAELARPPRLKIHVKEQEAR